MSSKQSAKDLYTPLRDAYLWYQGSSDWHLPQQIRASLIEAGLQPDAVERFYLLGGNFEQVLAALNGVNIYA